MKHTLGQVVRITRSILIQPYSDNERPSVQFTSGNHHKFNSLIGTSPGICWWYSADTFKAKEALASLLKEMDRDFKDCDTESVVTTISKTFQEICLDREIFNSDAVFLRQKPNLFECRQQISVDKFAERILNAIKSNLRGIIGRRCTLYSLPRYRGRSFMVPGTGLRTIAKTDESAWSEFAKEGYVMGGWSPQSPRLNGSGDCFPARADYEYVLVSEEYGTQQGAKFSSSIRFRKLITIMYAVATARSHFPSHKAMAQPFRSCLQFPHSSAPDLVINQSDCDALSPYYTSDIILQPDAIQELQSWYRDSAACSADFKQRLDKATYFVNRGMNAEDIEDYINHFVALDALFGEGGSVEASILSGIQKLALGQEQEEKVRWLFDLRNELVHGGSRYITEWPKYHRYVSHFKTKPLADIGQIARWAILRAPGHFSI
jgi:hypothetical protein